MKYLAQPIGTEAENDTGIVWCGLWFDATGYARRYRIGSPLEAFHTGVDLNCNLPNKFDADKLAPVYSIGDGVVFHAKKYSGWGNLIVIRHEVGEGLALFARYAHVDTLGMVTEGMKVESRQPISRVGNAFGTVPYHLHFDISFTSALEKNAADWPRLDLPRLKRDYADPRAVLQQYSKPINPTSYLVQVTTPSLNIRSAPNMSAAIVGKIPKDMLVRLLATEPVHNVYTWQRIAEPPYDKWVATEYTMRVNL